MTDHLSPTAALRAFLLLTGFRWFPVGLVVGVTLLLPVERGLTAGQAVTMFGVMGFVVLALELPTSGLADSWGRRPLLLVAGLFNIASAVMFLLADTFRAFVAAIVLMGVYRALDSGPLEAWYVDTVHATEPGADVDRAMAAHGVVTGLSMSSGALLSGALIWWDPISTQSPLLLPFQIWAGLGVVHLVALWAFMKEPSTGGSHLRGVVRSARETPRTIASGIGLLRSSSALRGAVVATVFVSVAMVVFEALHQVRLAELLGSEARAGAWMGPVAALGWGAFAAGSTLVGLAARRLGVARAAQVSHLLTSIGAAVMGLVVGPVGLVAAYLVTYGMFGAAGPMHATLLHREAYAENRSTVLSINSMAAFAAFSVAAPALGLLADTVGLQASMVGAGVVSLGGVWFYRAAREAEQQHVPSASSVSVTDG